MPCALVIRREAEGSASLEKLVAIRIFTKYLHSGDLQMFQDH